MKRTRYIERQIEEREHKLQILSRYNEREGKEDRLSNLPDSILLEIISYLSTKEAVQTCILGKRWKDLWKNLPALRLDSRDFETVVLFNRFLSRVLSRCNKSTLLHRLDFNRNGVVETPILNKVIQYALSHQGHPLCCTDLISIAMLYRCKKSCYAFPSSLFSCQNSLTSLEIFIETPCSRRPLFPKSLNMPCLAILGLGNFAFCEGDNMDWHEPFSNCNNLKTLEIRDCVVKGTKILCISNATLANLAIQFRLDPLVEAYKIELSTPNLNSLTFKGFPALPLTACNLSFLQQVDIDAQSCYYRSSLMAGSLIVINWLKVLANVTSLTLSWSTLQDISTLLKEEDIQPPCFGNLKTLKVGRVNTDDAVNSLLRNSPSAEVTVIRP